MASLLALSPLFAALGAATAAGGAAASQTRDVAPFHAVHVASGIHVVLEVGPQKALELSGDREALERVQTDVEHGELRIRFAPFSNVSTHDPVVVRVVAPAVRSVSASGGSRARGQLARGQALSVEVSGGGEAELTGLDAPALRAQGSGGATLTLSGRAASLELQLSGGSTVHAQGLEAGDVELRASGGCQGELRAAGDVRGSLSGGSQIHLLGKARARVSTSGGSSLRSGAD